MKSRSIYPFYVFAFVVLLVFSIHGVTYIPAWSYRGLDFQNLWAFHTNCPGWPIPYGATGEACGDPLGRPLLYPPLVYWFMGWTRFFGFYLAEILWSVAIPLLTVLGTYLIHRGDEELSPSSRESRRAWLPWVWSITFLQMPMIYAVERGNNDAAVIPVYGFAVFLFARKKIAWSGALLAAACWMKVYPVIPSFVLICALALNSETRRKELVPLLKGFIFGGSALALLLTPDSLVYLLHVLPNVASDPGGFGQSSHTLFRGAESLFIKIPVLLLWIYLTKRMFRRDPVLVMTAGLAISTFFQNLSNDYNLITAYPFLFIILKRLLRPRMGALDFLILLLTFAAFVGDRTPLEFFFPNRAALLTQVFWIILFPAYLLIRSREGRRARV